MPETILPSSILNRPDIEGLRVHETRRQPYGTTVFRTVIKSRKSIIWESKDFDSMEEAQLFSVGVVDELNEAQETL